MLLETETPLGGQRVILSGKPVTVHFVEQSSAFGGGGGLEGAILVETADGVLHRIKGPELAELSEKFPAFRRICQEWRLPG